MAFPGSHQAVSDPSVPDAAALGPPAAPAVCPPPPPRASDSGADSPAPSAGPPASLAGRRIAGGSSFALPAAPCAPRPVPTKGPHGASPQGAVSCAGRALLAAASGLTPARPRLVDGARPAEDANSVVAAPQPQRAGSDKEPSGSCGRSLPFTKHEKLRLPHVLCDGDMSSGVMVSRGPMSRQQKDARTSCHAVWVVLEADLFNSNREFVVPNECYDGGIDPKLHPHKRTGELLQAEWSEVRAPLPQAISPRVLLFVFVLS